MNNIREVLQKTSFDDALVKNFLGIWPVVESTLEAFSKATALPIFGFLDGEYVFQSSKETMPPFCKAMLNAPETAALCVTDGRRRALKEEPELQKGVQLCHAGMINGRREIETGVGTMVILFGSKKSADEKAVQRRKHVIEYVGLNNPALSAQLEQAAKSDQNVGLIVPSDAKLMDAITTILKLLLTATVQFRALTINMAHELSVMLLGMGMLAQETQDLVEECKKSPDSAMALSDLVNTQSHIGTECRLGLYIVRNFLSHTSENRYNEVIRPGFEEIDLKAILMDMVDLYRRNAAKKRIEIDMSGVLELPAVRGSAMELRRLFHNILNNAVKYSYHSIPQATRTIRIRSRVPYDPGFRDRRFSIAFENYGLGLTEQEKLNVFKPGFRGQQAVAEIPIGAGIGLSEAAKIMHAHNGQIKFQSRELHTDELRGQAYLTTVDVIFPYTVGSQMERR